MVAFTVVVPKNTGLREITGKTLELLPLPPNKEPVEARGEDVPFLVEQLLKQGNNAIGLTGEDLFREYCLINKNTKLKIIRRIGWDDEKALYKKPVLCLLGKKDLSLLD